MLTIDLRASARTIIFICGTLLLVGCQTTNLAPRAEGYLQGVFKDRQSDSPIVNERIMLARLAIVGGKPALSAQGVRTATTDTTGSFRFDNVPQNTLLILTAVDEKGDIVTVSLSSGDLGRDIGVVYRKQK